MRFRFNKFLSKVNGLFNEGDSVEPGVMRYGVEESGMMVARMIAENVGAE